MSRTRRCTVTKAEIAAFLLAALAAGCSPGDSRGASEPGGQPGSRFTLRVQRAPLVYTAILGGEEVVAQRPAPGAPSSLFFVTEAGVQHLTDPLRFAADSSTLDAIYETTDGRRAHVRIGPREHGGLRVSVVFDPSEGILGAGELLAARPYEHFHGLSERVRGNDDDIPRDPSLPVSLDRRGHDVEMVTNGTISLYSPFYLSSAGYGLFVEGTFTGAFHMASRDPERVRFRFDGPSLAYHLFPGPDPETIIERYTRQIGPPILPPRWAFGHYRWRNDHTNRDTLYDGTPYRGPINSEVYEDVAMMAALDIPLTVYWVDRPWAVGPFGYDDFEWDPQRFPNPEGMIEWLDRRGTRFLVWLAPWVMGDMAAEAVERGYFLPATGQVELGLTRAAQMRRTRFLRDTLKPNALAWIAKTDAEEVAATAEMFFSGPLADVDEDDPGAVAAARRALHDSVEGWTEAAELRRIPVLRQEGRVLVDFTNPAAVAWWQGYVATLLEDGVDAFKLDRAEEIVPAGRDVFAHDGRSMAEVHNLYPVLYAKAVHDVARRHLGDDFVVMPRAGYPGSQRYAVFWAGDTDATWLGLRNALIGAQRAAIMGYPFWTSDTGGYDDPDDPELIARWLGMSAFSPMMEVGPTSNRAPWSMPNPPHYDTALIATWRTYARLHMHLQDYTYRYAREAHDTGHPIMRPLFYEYPGDEHAWAVWDEYLYGEDYLVAPVLRKGATSREVYLPEGVWIDYWHPERVLRGPTTVTVRTPAHQTPIFAAEDAREELLDLNLLYRESLEIARRPPTLGGGSEIRLRPANGVELLPDSDGD